RSNGRSVRSRNVTAVRHGGKPARIHPLYRERTARADKEQNARELLYGVDGRDAAVAGQLDASGEPRVEGEEKGGTRDFLHGAVPFHGRRFVTFPGKRLPVLG